MQGKLKKGLFSLLILSSVIVAAQCIFEAVFGPPLISMRNESQSILQDVHFGGAKWATWDEYQLPEALQPGRKIEFIRHVRGTGRLISCSFVVDGKKHDNDTDTYVEERGGYCIKLTVNPDLSVTRKVGLGCFSIRRALTPWMSHLVHRAEKPVYRGVSGGSR